MKHLNLNLKNTRRIFIRNNTKKKIEKKKIISKDFRTNTTNPPKFRILAKNLESTFQSLRIPSHTTSDSFNCRMKRDSGENRKGKPARPRCWGDRQGR